MKIIENTTENFLCDTSAIIIISCMQLFYLYYQDNMIMNLQEWEIRLSLKEEEIILRL